MDYSMNLLVNDWIDREIGKLNEQQKRCHSRIDDLELQHQTDTLTHFNLQSDSWNHMRNTINEETRKEKEFLESWKQKYVAIFEKFEAWTRAGEKPLEKIEDLGMRLESLHEEMRQRHRLVLDISENGRFDVACTRGSSYDQTWPIVFWRGIYTIRETLFNSVLYKSRSSILDKQAECLDVLEFEKENEHNKNENNYNLSKRHIERKFNTQIRFVKDQASAELKILDTHGQKFRDLEKRTDIFQKRLEMLYANGKSLLSPSYEAALQKEAESLKKEWDALLAFKVPEVFDLKFEITRGVLKVTCTSSNGTAVCPGNTKKGKGKRQKTSNNGVVSV